MATLKIEKVWYWPSENAICVDFISNETYVVICDGEIAYYYTGDGSYAGYDHEYCFITYDLCALLALWNEVYGGAG